MRYMEWYKVTGYKGHVGAGKSAPLLVYIRANDITEALDLYLHLPFIKKGRATRFPDIRKAKEDVESIIENDPRIKNKNCFYYLINQFDS